LKTVIKKFMDIRLLPGHCGQHWPGWAFWTDGGHVTASHLSL